MEGLMVRGCTNAVPSLGTASCTKSTQTAISHSLVRFGLYTQCGALAAQGVIIFVSGSSEL